MAPSLRFAIAALLAVVAAPADISKCACDPARPETMKARECSLCGEAEKQPPDAEFFVLKDINPRKPNRWLVLPRAHGAAGHDLHELDPATRTRYWKRAIEEAQARFGDGWGIAYNGWRVRTQCHTHLHIGRWLPAAENGNFKFIRRVEDIPAPEDGGVLVHPVKGGFHVHTGENIMETALLR
jgi:diadenosine tetraphosphate (Ap4A) HIT family hydrolase